jgi:hypothetical protein
VLSRDAIDRYTEMLLGYSAAQRHARIRWMA